MKDKNTLIKCDLTPATELIYRIEKSLLLFLLLLICCCSNDSDIDLIINNSGDTSIFDVSIKDSHLPFIKEIRSGESKIIKLKPRGESHLDVRYMNVRKEIKTVKGGYFEGKRYKGKITVIIGNNDKIEVIEKFEIF